VSGAESYPPFPEATSNLHTLTHKHTRMSTHTHSFTAYQVINTKTRTHSQLCIFNGVLTILWSLCMLWCPM